MKKPLGLIVEDKIIKKRKLISLKFFHSFIYKCGMKLEIKDLGEFCDSYHPDIWSRGYYLKSDRICTRCIYRIPDTISTLTRDNAFKKKLFEAEKNKWKAQ